MDRLIERPLDGRCALVTGSTAGIGLATAKLLAQLGANVVLNGSRDKDGIDQVCASLAHEHSIRATFCNADMSDRSQIAGLVEAALAHGGGHVDILVNNAGYAFDSAVESIADEDWERQVAVNFSAPFYLMKGLLPAMRRRGWGRIVNVSSVMGLVGFPLRAGYAATKHGLIGLTKVVALETADTAITCNAVCPGMVATERIVEKHRQSATASHTTADAVRRQVMAVRQPSGNYITSEDIAASIAFLCGPNAGEIRGTTLTLDGGWSAR